MKKYAVILVLMIFNFGFGQSIDILPKDENGKIHFSKIISSNDLNQKETYNKTKMFFINNFNSGKDVIQMEDNENNIIIGKGNTTIQINSGKYKIPISMSFTIRFESKDHKCKMEIYNIVYNNESPAELFFNNGIEEKYKSANEKAKIIMENYRDQTIEKVSFLESKIKSEFDKKNQDW